MDITIFTTIAQWLGFEDAVGLMGTVAASAAVVIALTQSFKALLPKYIYNSRVLYVSAALSLIPALFQFWPSPFGFRGLMQALFVGLSIFLTATGVWSSIKTQMHKVGTAPTNASGGATTDRLGGSSG